MLASLARQRAPRPSRHRHSVKSPGADNVAAVEVRTAGLPSSEDGGDLADRPTLDDFGGRSDALGG